MRVKPEPKRLMVVFALYEVVIAVGPAEGYYTYAGGRVCVRERRVCVRDVYRQMC